MSLDDDKTRRAFEHAIKHHAGWQRIRTLAESSKLVTDPTGALEEAFEEAYWAGYQRGEGDAWRQAAREMADGAPPGTVT